MDKIEPETHSKYLMKLLPESLSTRFLQKEPLNDKEKKEVLEALASLQYDLKFKTHELEIEHALENVRAVAMGMKEPSDMLHICGIICRQLTDLDVRDIRNIQTAIFNPSKTTYLNYEFYKNGEKTIVTEVDYTLQPDVEAFAKAMLKGPDTFFTKSFTGKEVKDWIAYQVEKKQYVDPLQHEATALHYYFYSIGHGALGLSSYSPLSEKEISVFRRFRNVFELAYRMHIEINNARKQAHEAQIEAALERVRSKAMAMRSSEDLVSTVDLMYNELNTFRLPPRRCGIGLMNRENREVDLTGMAANGADLVEINRQIKLEGHPVLEGIYQSWLRQKEFHTVLQGDQLRDYQHFLVQQMGLPVREEDGSQFGYYFSFPQGSVYAWTQEALTEDEVNIYRRFTGVLGHTYRRYQDLKEAEAQAREARIEASLERVRTKAMAMHNSGDLAGAAGTVFTELKTLGVQPIRSGFVLLSKNSRRAKLYPATSFDKEKTVSFTGEFEFTGHPIFEKQYESWTNEENYFPVLEGEVLLSYYRILSQELSVPFENFPTDKRQFGTFLPFPEGFLFCWSEEPYPEETVQLLNRFKTILTLTIRRYQDLQAAEAQAREATIEAALERVRSRAMAMHKSEDLNNAVGSVFNELEKISPGMIRCGIGILDRDKRWSEVFTTTIADEGSVVQVSGDEPMDIHPLLQGAFDAWLRQGDFSYVLEGDDMSAYYRAVRAANFRLPDSQSLVDHDRNLKQYYYASTFQAGALFAFRETEFSEESKSVMKRFAGVFHLTYQRFLDIQNAEAHARKAQEEEEKLREEKKRSDALLLNILPEEIANELKQFGKSYARKHKEVTVLFADIKNFSSIAEDLSAEELVTQLDECFRAFDKITEKHGLEKIKTVGDAYVCACGLPKPIAGHAAKTVGAAFDMLEFTKGFGMTKKIQNLPAFEFRIGIHTGPVVTGVVGLKKFTYDIWGDAVNVAARMEQHGEAGKINISGSTYELIKDHFRCVPRGKIDAKNKGQIDMYFVERSVSAV